MSTQVTLIFCDAYNIFDEWNDYAFTFYNDQRSCINCITSSPKSEVIFLITSVTYATDMLPEINALRQLNSIFIYSTEEEYKTEGNLLNQYPKIIGVYIQLQDLYSSIKKNLDYAIKKIETFKFYEQHQKSTRQLSNEAGSFLWLRLFKDVILKLPHDEQAKQEMIEKLRECYHNDNKQLKLIDKFSQEYKSENALYSYTRDLFLYKQLNRALRTEDIELLYKFRYFIIDLSKSLLSEYEVLKDELDCTITMYRGVQLTNEEAQKFEKNIGKLISTNGYLSTTFSEKVALSFSGESTDNETSVLFEIKYDLVNTKSVILASIAHYSNNRDEEEVLFDLDAAFEILSVSKDEILNKLIVKMKATDQGSILAQEYIKEHRRQINISSVPLIFGRLLMEIGQYDKSQQYFEDLLEKRNEVDLSSIYYYLGAIHNNKGHYDKALQCYESSYDELINSIPAREGASCYVLNDIGSIFCIKGQYDKAFSYYMRALKINENSSDYHGMSVSLGNIGMIYRIKGEYDLALDNHMKCYEIQKNYLPSEHKDIARTLDHIAAVYNDKDDLSNAMNYHEKSLKMNETCLPVGHDHIGSNLNGIATILTNQGKYDEALDYYNRSLKTKESAFSNGHISIVKILCKIGYVYYLKKDYDLASDYLNQSMKMRETLFPNIEDISLMNTFIYFGLVLTKQQEYDNALIYFTRALNLAQILLPIGHENITDCLTNMGIIYREMKDYSKAFEYYEKAVKNEEQNRIKPNLIRLARNSDNMGICLYDQGNIKNGLEYRMKAVKLIEQISPRAQYADWVDTVGNVFFTNEFYDCALECYLISLNMRLECLPNDHIDVADSLSFLGDVYDKKHLQTQAHSYYEKALIIYENKAHFNTIYVLDCIGMIHENMCEYQLALEYYKKAAAFLEKYFPTNIDNEKTIENNITRVKGLIK